MDFRYRYVGFGTAFSSVKGNRTSTVSPKEDAQAVAKDEADLYENELVVDVGGVCWGYCGETLAVLDHHFHRPEDNQFPSASAAVLHNAQRVHDRFKDCGAPLWLVTHRDPDFDALCALFLARRMLEGQLPARGWEDSGLGPEGWGRTQGEIDWRAPRLPEDSERRCAMLLAAFASAVDNGWRMVCPRQCALHSVLYAGLYLRGRAWLAEGAQEFFAAVAQGLRGDLNPMFDSVLEGNPAFARELRLLDRDKEAYARDLLRARKTVVHLATCNGPFQNWLERRQGEPLLDRDLKLLAPHQPEATQKRAQADGIFIRDPESLLFKEWARQDLEHSPLGKGFLFTAVAWSGARSNGLLNSTDYYFSLDPEKAGNCHLYDVWATLQQAEIRALQEERWAPVRRKLEEDEVSASKTSRRTICRPGYEGRAGVLGGLFRDPWFDGCNYRCTLVATPNAGTLIGAAGSKSDLSDDPVAERVRRRLEFCIYRTPVSIKDFPSSASQQEHAEVSVQLDQMEFGKSLPAPAPAGCYRFGSVQLDGEVNLEQGPLPEQIGRLLWRVLNVDDRDGLPTDFLDRHLVVHAQWVGVWSRRGMVVAHKPAARQTVEHFRLVLSRMASLAAGVERLAAARDGPGKGGPERRKAEDFIHEAARLKHQLALPESRLPARFFDATGMDRVLELLRDIQATENLGAITHVQKVIEYVEVFLVAAYSVYLIYYLGQSFHFPDGYIGWCILGGSGIAAILTGVLSRLRGGGRHARARLVLIVLIVAGLLGVYVAGGFAARQRAEQPSAQPSVIRSPAPSEAPP